MSTAPRDALDVRGLDDGLLQPDGFRELADTLVEGVLLHDAEGHVVWGNAAAERLLGLDLARLHRSGGAQPGVVWLDENGLAVPVEAMPQAGPAAGQPSERRCLVAEPGGQRRTLRVSSQPLQHGAGVASCTLLVEDTSAAHAALEATQSRLGLMFEGLRDYFYTDELGPGRRVRNVFQGPGRERLLGGFAARLEPEEEWIAAIHPEDAELWTGFMASAHAGEVAVADYRLRGHDGATRWVRHRGCARRTAEGRTFFDGVVSDITESRLLDDELMTTIAEMNQVNAELVTSREEAELQARVDALTGAYNRRHFGEVLGQALGEAPTRGEGPVPGLILLDVDRFKHVNDTYGHGVGDEVLTAVATRLRRRVRQGDCVARWGGEEFCVLVLDLSDDVTLRRIGESLRETIGLEPVATSAGPLTVTASFGAVRMAPEVMTIERLVDAADKALYSAKRRGRNQVRLYVELKESDLISEEPETVRVAQALALAVSIREGMPELHSQHIADLAVKVAERLGAGPATVLRCRLGGWLHDVGKIAIPDRVLAKPSALDEDEWALMKQHTVVGEHLVKRVAGLSEAAAAVRHHHERYDGSGYPDGLAGEAIPIEARILAAVDAFSTITSDRVFQPGRGRTDAVAELQRCAGTHFDPEVIAAIVATLDEEDARMGRRLTAFRRADYEAA